MYGCCPDGLTARQTDDNNDACLTSTTSSTSPQTSAWSSPVSDHATAFLTTVATTTVATETSLTTVAVATSSSTTAKETTTAHVVGSSELVTREDVDRTQANTTRRVPAYRMTSPTTSDITAVMTAHDDDKIRRGACYICVLIQYLVIGANFHRAMVTSAPRE